MSTETSHSTPALAAADARQSRAVRWRDVLILALIAVIAYLLGRGAMPGMGAPLTAKAVSENQDMIAVTGEFGMGTSVLYLIDTKKRSLVVYEARGGSQSELRLIAARDVTYDMRLRSYNDSTEASMRVDELERKWRSFSRENEQQGKKRATPDKKNKKITTQKKPANKPAAK